ncbi:MFS transporter [Pseudobacter ginsenosidimutans]|jgi:ACS family hexuronate transporter-like MFS transporter|uniref:ACS family hexuronate transporter-like MFS transporter n=1 Tax=Pseudobacter ginsenosidimutans TaxID=661488 RepID=A0A4Q7MAM5_9BACT|nr:MFS transporter [Pseudobacter ginsenosidimutans]QEC42795.1 MFS transporter [Pseudobacter ginsenosidimutans]RZS65046.1 ACS family hexuronate transporter-like MFS transporter [Pseudobacter ginsenosidimutans]
MQQAIGKYRWTICTLIFFATTINYLDRQVISLVKGYVEKEFNWTEIDYANLTVAFQLSYAIAMMFIGRLIDKLGTKLGYAASLIAWSIAAIGHGFISSTGGFFVARAALGVTEAGNFPAAIKTTAEWFPKKERSLATGIFNSGSNIGAIIAPLTVPFIAEALNWRMAFVITGAVGLIWLIFWFWLYEIPARSKRLSKAEFDYIHSDEDEQAEQNEANAAKKISWGQLLGYRQTWAFALGKFMTDGIWWFYLFWLPDFLKKQYHLTNTDIAVPVAIVYTIAAFGSIFGGWVPGNLIKNNWPVFKARKTSMFIYALFVLPVMAAQYLGSFGMWYAVLIIGLAAAAHQAWSANIFTTVSDMFPKRAVASITGIGGMAGGLGGILIAKSAGYLFEYYKGQGDITVGYMIMFVICGLAYLTAWLVMHLLVPKMKRVTL